MFDDCNPNESSNNEDSSLDQHSISPGSAPETVIMSPMVLRPLETAPAGHIIS